MGIITIPWSFRIFYGFLSDNIRILGTKRKGHIVMNTACCVLTMCILIIFHNLGKYFIVTCITISQLNMAYNDTVVEALIVKATNLGIINGSQSLNSVSYMFQAFGAITGALIVIATSEQRN